MAVIGELVGQVAADAGVEPSQPLAEHGAFYLAGADLPVEMEMLHRRIQVMGWSTKVVVDNDTFALLRAGSEHPDRVAVVCGAGINCVGVSADGGVVRFPALGRLSGDWGGGADLGSEALWHAVRAEDGRGRPTALRDGVARHFGTASVTDVVAAIHLREIPADRLHELALVLFAAAADGDDVARTVVTRLAEEVMLLATVALRRLSLLTTPADVVLGGGVLSARDPMLLGTVTALVLREAPHARLRVVDGPPVVGAALLGLDALGVPPGAEGPLRSALLERTARA